MSQQVQELIDKIKSEGIDAAQKKGQEIESQAQKKAQETIEHGQKRSEQMIVQAKEEIKKFQEAAQANIKQAARDTLLNLKREINQILQALITQEVSDTLTPENLAAIITAAVKSFLNQQTAATDVRVALSPTDLEKLRNGFLAKLQDELTKPIQCQANGDMHKGFTISFDGGKSSFDFSDASLAEYLGTYLNEEVAALVKEAVKS